MPQPEDRLPTRDEALEAAGAVLAEIWSDLPPAEQARLNQLAATTERAAS